jgi:isocitrate/isopropylmalate dehydrogenase
MNLGKEYAVFEPTHGSAPDIAGRDMANPIAMILSAVLMLRHLGEQAPAARLEHGVAKVLSSGKARTADLRPLGEPTTTSAMAEAIAEASADQP